MFSEDANDSESFYSCHCTADSCRERCGHEIVDVLLHEQAERAPDLVDSLLDLKSALAQRSDAEQILETFCELRRRLEKRYYLAFYRMRRWLENQMEAQVSRGRGYAPRVYPIRLKARTLSGVIESIRAEFGESEKSPPQYSFFRVEFAFRAKTRTSRGLLA